MHTSAAQDLAVGYTEALAVHDTEATETPLSLQEAQQLQESTVVVLAGQLLE